MKQNFTPMRITYVIITLIICFCMSLHAENRGNDLMKQAQTNLEQKEYTKSRYLYIQAYKAFADGGEYANAIECGTKAAYLYYRENYYQEAFDLCRQMTQYLMTEEQKAQTTYYDQRFMLSKERLQMYIQLKNAVQAQIQLNTLENIASQSESNKLSDELLYTQASYYYTFGQNEQGDAAFQKLITQYKEKKKYDKVSECYRNLIDIARKANNASLVERTYKKYTVWTDSVKALNAQDELGALQLKYDESQKTILEKDDKLSGKQYMIAGLCTLAAILIAALLFLAFLLLRFIVMNKKLKSVIKTTNEHSEQQTHFIQSISEQIAPTLEVMTASVNDIGSKAPQQAEAIKTRINAIQQFGMNIQELSSLENSLLEPYEAKSFNVGSFCKKIMEKVQEDIQPDTETHIDVPQFEIKTNAEQLERVLLHLLRNAALHTTAGKISLEFKKKGAHLCNFIITNNGEGFTTEQKENLFKPFTKVKDLAEGDGLGLPICALVATKLNGNLSIDMEYKKGYRFILVLQI